MARRGLERKPRLGHKRHAVRGARSLGRAGHGEARTRAHRRAHVRGLPAEEGGGRGRDHEPASRRPGEPPCPRLSRCRRSTGVLRSAGLAPTAGFSASNRTTAPRHRTSNGACRKHRHGRRRCREGHRIEAAIAGPLVDEWGRDGNLDRARYVARRAGDANFHRSSGSAHARMRRRRLRCRSVMRICGAAIVRSASARRACQRLPHRSASKGLRARARGSNDNRARARDHMAGRSDPDIRADRSVHARRARVEWLCLSAAEFGYEVRA